MHSRPTSIKWIPLASTLLIACSLGFLTPHPRTVIIAAGLIALALASFVTVSNSCLPRLPQDGLQEMIATAVWMGFWLVPCAFLSRGWVVFGLFFALCGYFTLVTYADDVVIDDDVDLVSRRDQLMRAEIQYAVRNLVRR